MEDTTKDERVQATDRRKSGFVWLDNKVFDMGLDPYQLAVYVYIAYRCNPQRGSGCYESKVRWAERLGIARNTLKKALEGLQGLSMIRVEPGPGERDPMTYYLTDVSLWSGGDHALGWSGGDHALGHGVPEVWSRGDHQQDPGNKTTEQESLDLGEVPKVLPSHEALLEYLKSKTGSTRMTKAGKIKDRLEDGYTEDQLKAIIDFKCEEWLHDPKMRQFLRVDTLFGPETIIKYVDAAQNWVDSGRPLFGPKQDPLDHLTTPEEADGIEESFRSRGARI